jgi:tetratricopeptide (TPR) repeat protein
MVTSAPSAAAAAMMSPHRDVLEAVPDTTESKAKLVEELKGRGRAAVGAKSWMDAKLLYEKALTVVDAELDPNTTAVLASNLSLVELKMNHADAAVAAAQKATEADAVYVKSWWRLGQALIATKQHEKALEALKKAQSLEPSNKALIKEVEKVQVTIDEISKAKAESGDVEMTDATPSTSTSSSSVQPPKPTSQTSTTTSEKKKEASTTTASDDGGEKNEMRGYKIVNGKKTSYFHNELSDEAKALIGDIAPKKLDNPPPPSSTTAAQNKNGMSAWNVST